MTVSELMTKYDLGPIRSINYGFGLYDFKTIKGSEAIVIFINEYGNRKILGWSYLIKNKELVLLLEE